jgi:hypothetical protein
MGSERNTFVERYEPFARDGVLAQKRSLPQSPERTPYNTLISRQGGVTVGL